MQTTVVLTILGLAVALRLWAVHEIGSLKHSDPQFADALRRARNHV
jgi:hypothetical protein